ncbi:Protein STB3 [Colletotrichum chlorophyti]|uniref:Protein STB3 n=1 Tax=Colletotrichum chlorophyti TaxID=708187 RepID=A0A1Q8S032_9PEZI|nr:Protein STB3 [Colletotrichum chlorophyti]
MATMAAAVCDIPQASSVSRDNLTVVAARSVPATTVTRSHTLPTPPNSISPALPPHGLKAQLQKAKLEPIDSDLDLHDDHASRRREASQSPPYDSTGTISTALLAKHHLPDILLNHGPLAIRHIMGYLTTSVPGFAGIPPTKARRLVVGALEGRGSEGGGPAGDVEFEKVGWGRWDARRRGQPPRTSSPPTDYRTGIPITNNGGRGINRSRLNLASSSAGDSIVFSHDDRDAMMMEDEADKMSLDGSASASCSEAPDDDDIAMNDDPEDATDDEDWAAVGAAALRAESYSNANAGAGRSFLSTGVYTSGGMRSVSTGMARSLQPMPFDFSALGATSDAQEREAVEALLRLGSV